jgi:arginase family enzyme
VGKRRQTLIDQEPVIGQAKMAAVHQILERTREAVQAGSARQERMREAVLHGSVPTFMELPLAREPTQLAGADAVILGFPFEGPTSLSPSRSAPPNVARPPKGSIYWRMGADQSPDEIRKYSAFYSRHHNRGYYPEIDRDLILHDALRIVDYGNVRYNADDTMESIQACMARVREIVRAGAMPIVLGGDHTTPYPVVKAVLEQHPHKVGLVVFDAHVDFSYTPDEYWASNQWLQLVLETGKIDPENMVEIGIRSNRSAIQELELAESLGVRVITIDEVKARGIAAIVQEAIALATRGSAGLYVSLDIDCMEPSAVPSQKAPEIWGMTVDELFCALRILSRQDVIGFDVCEYTPDYDINGMGAQFCARAVVEMLGGLALRKRERKEQ